MKTVQRLSVSMYLSLINGGSVSPILDREVGNPFKIFEVSGDQSASVSQCDAGDEHVCSAHFSERRFQSQATL